MFKDKSWTDGVALIEAEIPADPALPQLATMLAAGLMGRIFQDALPEGFAEGRLRIERCRIKTGALPEPDGAYISAYAEGSVWIELSG